MLRQVVTQSHLERAVHDIFPSEKIITNARKSLDIRSQATEHYLEVDVYIPRLQLGIEFQDFYHYATTWYYQNPISRIKSKDSNKLGAVTTRGISLITVPCWWDASQESLIETINFERPDVLACSNPDDLITLNPPEDFFDTWDVPEVGEVMLCSFAESPSSIFINKNHWWLGEKYDGIRCLWNQCDLYTRKGMLIELEPAMTKLLVATHSNFDSEIWYGRGMYHEAVPVLKGTPDWSFYRMLSFDNPSPLLHEEPLEHRYECVMAAVLPDHPFLIVPARIFCSSPKLLVSALQRILESGGEGVVASARRSLYRHGRSSSLVKFKAAQADMEALVVSSVGDTVKLQLPSGTIFEVKKTDFNLHSTVLTKGDVVTFDYEGRSRTELPMGPKFSRIRTDISWDDVLAEYTGTGSLAEDKFTEQPRQFWTTKEGRNLREYFENYAKKLNLDPLLPATWYSISGKFFTKKLMKRGYQLRQGGYKQALLSLFPEIGLKASNFPTLPAGYWENVDNRKRFFDELAKNAGFDPLVAKNWYLVAASKLESARGLLAYYGGSMQKALVHLYPNIGLDPSKFYVLPAKYWQEGGNVQRFFDEYAQTQGFAPQDAKNWYMVTVKQILGTQKGESLLKFCSKAFTKLKDGRNKRGYWKRVLATAIKRIYPDIGFKIKEFTSPTGFSRRRKFFEDYAKSRGFDPHAAENWYSIPKDNFLAERGGLQVLSVYDGSVMNALLDVFPNIGLERNEFPVPPGHWADPHNQKDFFDTFARKNAFDPLVASNWYSAPLEKFQSMRGYSAILNHFGGSILNGLLKTYPNIGLQKSNFQTLPSGFWSEWKNRREFFDSFAKEHGFDALVVDSWYSVTSRKIQSAKGGAGLLKHFPGQSAITALTDAYPELHFDRHKFSSLPNGYWENANNRKEYFDSFARENNFDPLVPSNWLSRSGALRERKSYNSVLQHYKGGLQIALSSIYGFPRNTS